MANGESLLYFSLLEEQDSTTCVQPVRYVEHFRSDSSRASSEEKNLYPPQESICSPLLSKISVAASTTNPVG